MFILLDEDRRCNIESPISFIILIVCSRSKVLSRYVRRIFVVTITIGIVG